MKTYALNQLFVELEPCNYEGYIIWIPDLSRMDDVLNREVINTFNLFVPR